ncbi:iron-siderophore ABC transporter substrate-binding protein [Arhodomonas sp. SL1]|uniref:iron-siderophore ABC transporter substrate-binding protein n=1 Tax=Arhodomonas sp. SL1 TaxID=3425691 RepID=UPI003F880AF6
MSPAQQPCRIVARRPCVLLYRSGQGSGGPVTARRGWVLLPVLLLLVTAVAGADGDGQPPRIATLDWTIAETLLALDVTPVGLAQPAAYRDWVGEPRLPGDVKDLGLRSQPSMERLAALEPDRILISPMFSHLEPRLSRIAPVTEIGLYAPDAPVWDGLSRLTRRVGALVGRSRAAAALIERTEAVVAAQRERLREIRRPLLVVQFMDPRHVRVFGEDSLYGAVIVRLGLDNAWGGATNRWGFALVGLEALIKYDARLVVVEPMPVGVDAALQDSALWRQLPGVADGSVVRLPPVWSFGGPHAAARFARVLTAGLTRGEHDE